MKVYRLFIKKLFPRMLKKKTFEDLSVGDEIYVGVFPKEEQRYDSAFLPNCGNLNKYRVVNIEKHTHGSITIYYLVPQGVGKPVFYSLDLSLQEKTKTSVNRKNMGIQHTHNNYYETVTTNVKELLSKYKKYFKDCVDNYKKDIDPKFTSFWAHDSIPNELRYMYLLDQNKYKKKKKIKEMVYINKKFWG